MRTYEIRSNSPSFVWIEVQANDEKSALKKAKLSKTYRITMVDNQPHRASRVWVEKN